MLDHFLYATDEISDLGVEGSIQIPPEVPLLVMKRRGRKEVGDEVLHHELIVCICFRPSLLILLLKDSQVLSEDQVPRHPKCLGSCG